MQEAGEPTALAGMRSMVDMIVDNPYTRTPSRLQKIYIVSLINPYVL